MNVKTYLMIRITLIALLCLVVAAGYVLWSEERQVQGNLSKIQEIVARHLQAQQVRIDAGFDRPERFPNLDPLLETGLLAGVCVKYVHPEGRITQSSCHGWDKQESVPAWFDSAYRATFHPGQEITRELRWRGKNHGLISVVADVEGHIEQAWHAVKALFGLTAITVSALCLLVYFAMARALKPAREILLGIERLERGELSVRLPHFELNELQKISAGFNRLAGSLEQTLQEKAELMGKLVNLQEEERRHMARELHDEFAQCLAAINAMAISVRNTARQECPKLVPEAQMISNVVNRLMDLLRGMLHRLRPPDFDQLGLIQSLRDLVKGWNARAQGTSFDLTVQGSFEKLPETLSVNLYRIVQECLTNASKHAAATQVSVILERTAPRDRSSSSEISLVVEDNGNASADAFPPKAGMGLLGMRERVKVLGGELSFQVKPAHGLIVRALIPTPIPA